MGLIDKSYLMTLNQRVQGSNPCAPTNHLNNLVQGARERTRHVLQRILQLCSLFEFHHGNFSELDVAAEIVGIEDRLDIPKAVAGQRCDLR
jgi:hypothetical protein